MTNRNFRRPIVLLSALAIAAVAVAFAQEQSAPPPAMRASAPASLASPGEIHLANIRQLTFGGQNAEAYFSADDRYLTFQHQGQFYDPATHSPLGPNIPCDQIYTIMVQTFDHKAATPHLVSNGKGRTTCSYFFPAGDKILHSSTFRAS